MDFLSDTDGRSVMLKILVVEDEKPISDLICLNLRKEGYGYKTAYDGEEAADLLEEENFDLVLLDIMLPKINGYELMEYIRPMGIPVIFLTAKSELNDRVKGLTSGAEDYIIKPFEVIELMARIQVVMRRYHKLDSVLRWEDVEIDVDNQRVTQAGKLIMLTPKEWDLLVFLVRNQGVSIYREKLYEEIWGSEFSVESRTLDLHIQRLRKKIDFRDSLKTVFRVGYRLESTNGGQG